eukprot:TRINITY_DN5153_c0_g1_i1.p1 TRINITY_DN5153_c0_g1~~TRINITY_DN5153_c0_g1_i1.p1  ORF type:complete len:490 (+),score=94.16 TRINITY_DN5153_c0_g1_i1:118-1587(+)
MSINISNIDWVGPNSTPFDEDFRWLISFDCIQELRANLEWKVTYVGSSEDSSFDQILESIPVGPIPVGSARFELTAPPPDPLQIPSEHALGATCVLLGCSYVGQEFINVGFFISNEYDTKELNEHPPSRPNFSRMIRNIAADKPKVTRYVIDWTLEDPNYEKEIEELNQHLSQPHDQNSANNEGEGAKQDRDFLAATLVAFPTHRENRKVLRSDFLPIFPHSVSLQIFSYLDLISLARVRRVSPNWKKIVDSGLYLTNISVDNLTGALSFAKKHSSPSMVSLSVSGTEISDDFLQLWLSQCGKGLKEIYLEDCKQLTEKATDAILNNCPVISSLFVGRSAVSKSESISKILKGVGGQILDLSLNKVSMKDLEEVVKVCGPNLISLEIPHSDAINEDDLNRAIRQCTKLKTLNIIFCPQISSTAVEDLQKTKKNLEVVTSISPSDFAVDLSKLEVKQGFYQVQMTFRIGEEIVPHSYITRKFFSSCNTSN